MATMVYSTVVYYLSAKKVKVGFGKKEQEKERARTIGMRKCISRCRDAARSSRLACGLPRKQRPGRCNAAHRNKST
eukprot:scaffold80_cov106-Isochrysis_galbana.AAC.7